MIIVLSRVTLHSQTASDEVKRAGDLTVAVSGLESNKGQLRIALFNSEDTYSDKKEPFNRGLVILNDKKAIWVFENIPFGEYAIICYHDENENNQMDKNIVGIPKEKYGFSNNAKGSFGMPDYENEKIFLSTKTKYIEIRVE